MSRRPVVALVFVMAGLAWAASVGGCARSTLRADERPTSRPVGDLGTGYFEPRVEAFVVPPNGWELDPPKINDQRAHLTWLSPSGDSAYGVIYFAIPGSVAWLPKNEFFHNRASDRFIDEFRNDTGDAVELSREWDADADGMRIVAEGGPYKVRSLLRIRGSHGWSVYAGTMRERPVNEEELAVAERAQGATQIARDAEGGADAAEKAIEGN